MRDLWNDLDQLVMSRPASIRSSRSRKDKRKDAMRFATDLRTAVRRLGKSPGFALAAVLTLGLGIGANTTLFSIVDAVVLRPLPYPRPAELLAVQTRRVQAGNPGGAAASAPDYLDWGRQSHAFRALGAASSEAVVLSGRGEPERLAGERVSPSFFAALGVRAALGRTFTPQEDRPGSGVVVLSHGLWKRRFGGDPRILGRSLRLDGQPTLVVGVMPAGFGTLEEESELWVPMAFTKDDLDSRGSHFLTVVGRLAPGVSSAQAQAEMTAIAARLAHEHPIEDAGFTVEVRPLHEVVTGGVRPLFLVLLGAVSFVLLIACANVANLLLARAATRQRELAVRAALGASRRRLMGEMLADGLPLALAGGLVGVLLALWGTDLAVAAIPAGLPRAGQIRVDGMALGFTLALSLLTGLAISLVPAFQTGRGQLNDALKDGGRSASGGTGRHATRSLLVVLELTLAAALLIGAGLTLKSFARLMQVDPGFRPAGLVAGRVGLADARYPTNAQQAAFLDAVLGRLRATPGVREAAAVSPLPLGGSRHTLSLAILGRPPLPPGVRLSANWRTVSPGYFHTMGIPLLAGRELGDRDREGAPGVLVINRTMAARHFPGENPIGKRIRIGYNDLECEIVGLVGDVKHAGLDAEAGAEMYTAFAQAPFPRVDLVVRMSSGAPPTLAASAASAAAAALRAAVRQVDPEQAVSQIQTLESLLRGSAARSRFVLTLLALFAALALLLAAVGLYGVMSWSVGERTHEIGIRMALGARREEVLGMVVRQGAGLILAGVGSGLLLAGMLARLISRLLFTVSPTDPAIFAAVPLVLAAVALVATWLPAQRATRVDPLVALQAE
jgi:putative ABC transport system permease protein